MNGHWLIGGSTYSFRGNEATSTPAAAALASSVALYCARSHASVLRTLSALRMTWPDHDVLPCELARYSALTESPVPLSSRVDGGGANSMSLMYSVAQLTAESTRSAIMTSVRWSPDAVIDG